MPFSCSDLAPRGRRAVVWTLLGLACCQASLIVLQDCKGKPETFDVSFADHLRRLQARRAEGRDRPLLLTLGTSRLALDFRPSALPALRPASDRTPLVFNFGMLASTPADQAEYFQTLLAHGLAPDWLVIEVWVPFFAHGLVHPPSAPPPVRLGWDNPRCIPHYLLRPWCDVHSWLQNQYLADWPSEGREGWRSIDEWGWWYPGRPELGKQEQYTQQILNSQRSLIDSQFIHSDASDLGIRRMLQTCRRRGVAAVLVEFPEGSAYRKAYAAKTRKEVDAYFARLCRDYGVVHIDARAWEADEKFMDGVHLNPEDATSFTERFGREVLQPLVEGRFARGQEQVMGSARP